MVTGFEGRSRCSVTICCLNRNTHLPNHTSPWPCRLKLAEVYQKALELRSRLVPQMGLDPCPTSRQYQRLWRVWCTCQGWGTPIFIPLGTMYANLMLPNLVIQSVVLSPAASAPPGSLLELLCPPRPQNRRGLYTDSREHCGWESLL